MVIKPQAGAQTNFLSSNADIVIYGGSAGSAKSFSLLLEALRHVNNPQHRAIIFRRTSPMLRTSGSIYNEGKELYCQLGAICNDTRLTFKFPSGATIAFSHLQSEDHRISHQGAQYSFIGFDELTQFTESQFSYLISRLRNPSITPYCRATCNPDSSSWVKRLVLPYLDSSGQFPDEEKSGKASYIGFSGENGAPVFSKIKTDETPLSFTFIPGKLSDNQILLKKNPQYESMLKSLPLIERQQLLFGDWSISYSAGNIFKRGWLKEFTGPPIVGMYYLGFDLASTTPSAKNRDPDWSAACLIQKNGFNTIIHKVWRVREAGGAVYNWMKQVAQESVTLSRGNIIKAYVEQEPGSASKREIEILQKELLNIVHIDGIPSTGNKVARARDASASAEKGHIFMSGGVWNEPFINELENFPDVSHDDQVDSFTLAFNQSNKTSLY